MRTSLEKYDKGIINQQEYKLLEKEFLKLEYRMNELKIGDNFY